MSSSMSTPTHHHHIVIANHRTSTREPRDGGTEFAHFRRGTSGNRTLIGITIDSVGDKCQSRYSLSPAVVRTEPAAPIPNGPSNSLLPAGLYDSSGSLYRALGDFPVVSLSVVWSRCPGSLLSVGLDVGAVPCVACELVTISTLSLAIV